MKQFALLTILLFAPFVAADDWEDFTNNLATDLAPLITLFGERLTKQFLSESISLLDNIIFALSPLGVLTAVVSVIRVCGSSSLRAFIGRAQEGPAEAESELLPCVSGSTAELFNDGGISRVFGRPKIVEVVAWENVDKDTGERSVRFGTLRDAIIEEAWTANGSDLTSEDLNDLTRLPELDIPNLSLNKGIKRRDQIWFYCAALLGAAMQIGVIVYASITVFLYPEDFQKDEKPVASYAFPFYIVGTTLLFAGMLFCAIIIERSSKEYYFKPKKPSKLFWLQPGNQHVGDQVFGAFMAVKQGPNSSMSKKLRYIKSTRFLKHDGRYVELYTILGSTMLGFIIQFVGLRGLHASVILAQLGSTLIMTILRTFLRTERMAPEENLLRNERDSTAYKKQELDAFAFYLHNVTSFEHTSPDSSISPATSRSNASDTYVAQSEKPLVRDIIKTRAILAGITSNSGSQHGYNVPWDDMPLRKVAENLAETIGMTMDLLSSWGLEYEKEFKFDLFFQCETEGVGSNSISRGKHPIRVQRSGDALKWRVDLADLEAIIGLSTWSLCKSDEAWKGSLSRMVGLKESESGKLETFLSFHKWIFRQNEARLASSQMVDSSKRLFGFDSDLYDSDDGILIVRTDNSVETMIAQDIYIHFLRSALVRLDELKGEAEVLPGIQGTLSAQHSQINDLANCFEVCNLGSREDALLCAVPILRDLGLLPSLAAYSPKVRELKETLINQNEWEKAFKLLEWVCYRCEYTEFEYSVYELGYLCRRALLVKDKTICKIGLGYTRKILSSDMRKEFLESRGISSSAPVTWTGSQAYFEWQEKFARQLGWVAWHISVNIPSAKWIQSSLQGQGAAEFLDTAAEIGQDEKYPIDSIKALQEWITLDDWDFERDLDGKEDEQAFGWALQEHNYALAYFLLLRWSEVGLEDEIFFQRAYLAMARYQSDWGIWVLKQHGADIEAVTRRKISALLQVIDDEDLRAVQVLLSNGANPDGNEKAPDVRPLLLAAHRGLTEVVALLLDHRASINMTDTIGMSALHWVSDQNRLETARLLLSRGAEIEMSGSDGTMPLHSAVTSGHLQMVDLLLDAGAEINAQEKNMGRTPLMFAASHYFVEIVHLLLQRKANLHVEDMNGSTALDWATATNSLDAFEVINQALRASTSEASID